MYVVYPPLRFSDIFDVTVSNKCFVVHDIFLLLSANSSGETLTTATWMRQVIRSHPEYKHDSVVTDNMVYDLLSRMKDISEGVCNCPELTGNLSSRLEKDSVKPSRSK